MKTLSEGAFTDRVLTQMAGTFTTLVKEADFSAAPTPDPARGRSPAESSPGLGDYPQERPARRRRLAVRQPGVQHQHPVAGVPRPRGLQRDLQGASGALSVSASAAREVYDFVYRAMLTEEALDVGRARPGPSTWTRRKSARLSVSNCSTRICSRQVRLMSAVYTAVAAFEISVRRFVKRVLMDTYGEDWWDKGVSEKVRKFVDLRRADEKRSSGTASGATTSSVIPNWRTCRRSSSRTGNSSRRTCPGWTGRRRCSPPWSGRAT